MAHISNVINVAKKIFEIENMPTTLIGKPYKKLAITAIKLCAVFSLLAFMSFTPLMVLVLAAAYIVFIYFTRIFISYCAKFGYKKIMCALVLSVLYFLCYFAAVNLRSFMAILFTLDIQPLFYYIIIPIGALFVVFMLIFSAYSWGKVFKDQLLMARDRKNRQRSQK